MHLRWAETADKHGISKARIRHVIEHDELSFLQPSEDGRPSAVVVWLGKDARGVLLEVIAIELDEADAYLVIHAMRMRRKYQIRYRRTKTWKRKGRR